MNLAKKKELASKVLRVGKERIVFSRENLSEIKEAITRQDILDLKNSGAITVKEVKGRRTNVKRKNRRRTGKIKLPVKKRKQEYVIITRKLRTFVKHLKRTGEVDKDKAKVIRKMIRARRFKSKRNLKEAYKDL